MLTDGEIAGMRETAGAALPSTAVIQTNTFHDNGGGGGTASWAASGTVDCRLAPMALSEGETADRVSEDANFIVTLPHNAAVDEDSRLIIDGETYNVEGVRERSWNLTTRVEVEREQ